MRGRRLTPLAWVLLLGVPVVAAITALAPGGVVAIAWGVVVLVILWLAMQISPSSRTTRRIDRLGRTWGNEDPGADAARKYEREHGLR